LSAGDGCTAAGTANSAEWGAGWYVLATVQRHEALLHEALANVAGCELAQAGSLALQRHGFGHRWVICVPHRPVASPVFPILPRSSGIYRLPMSDGPDQGLLLVYVGESDDLRRRTYHYRRPGPSQQTSQRIHDDLRAHLGAGGLVTLAISTAATIEAGRESSPLPLGRKTARVLAEHAALALIYLDGDAVVINRDKGADQSD
jgi:hypothetical protein